MTSKLKALFCALRAVGMSAVLPAAEPGVILRFDDVHDVASWRALTAAFDEVGAKASFAIPMAYVKTEGQRQFLREAAAKGHEIMDHTLWHSMFFCFCADDAEFAEVAARPFVAESDPKDRFVGFRFDFDRSHPGNRTFVGEITNGVLVVTPELARSICRPNKVYVPSVGRYYGFFDAPDGHIKLTSFYTYQRKAEVPDVPKGELLICDHHAFTLCGGALRQQAQLSRKAFRACGLPDPRTWIQPGGWDPWIPVGPFREVYEKEFGYVAADCIPGSGDWNGDPKAKDPDVARFTFRPDSYFDSSRVTPADVRARIAAARQKGRGICFISHMTVPPTMKGGWNEWLAETRSLLLWLKENGIPVRTFSEMSDFLFSLPQRAAAVRTSQP